MSASSHRVGTIPSAVYASEDNIFPHESQSAERLSYVGTHAQVSSFNRVGNAARFREVKVGA